MTDDYHKLVEPIYSPPNYDPKIYKLGRKLSNFPSQLLGMIADISPADFFIEKMSLGKDIKIPYDPEPKFIRPILFRMIEKGLYQHFKEAFFKWKFPYFYDCLVKVVLMINKNNDIPKDLMNKNENMTQELRKQILYLLIAPEIFSFEFEGHGINAYYPIYKREIIELRDLEKIIPGLGRFINMMSKTNVYIKSPENFYDYYEQMLEPPKDSFLKTLNIPEWLEMAPEGPLEPKNLSIKKLRDVPFQLLQIIFSKAKTKNQILKELDLIIKEPEKNLQEIYVYAYAYKETLVWNLPVLGEQFKPGEQDKIIEEVRKEGILNEMFSDAHTITEIENKIKDLLNVYPLNIHDIGSIPSLEIFQMIENWIQPDKRLVFLETAVNNKFYAPDVFRYIVTKTKKYSPDMLVCLIPFINCEQMKKVMETIKEPEIKKISMDPVMCPIQEISDENFRCFLDYFGIECQFWFKNFSEGKMLTMIDYYVDHFATDNPATAGLLIMEMCNKFYLRGLVYYSELIESHKVYPGPWKFQINDIDTNLDFYGILDLMKYDSGIFRDGKAAERLQERFEIDSKKLVNGFRDFLEKISEPS